MLTDSINDPSYQYNEYRWGSTTGYGDGAEYGTSNGDGCSASSEMSWGDGPTKNDGDGTGRGFSNEYVFIACTDANDFQAVVINTLVRAC